MPHNNGRYPGAYHLDLGGTGGTLVDTPENIFHIAASSWNADPANPTALTGINGWIEQGVTEAHTYTDEFGLTIQYCDLFERVAGTLNGNYRNRTHEAWNPPESDGDLNLSGYKPAQCERFSDFLAWDSRVNGTLLRDMGNSRATSHGCGCHRYGITRYDPWMTEGGEVWSTSSSKICPGTRRVQQLGGIIARAVFIRDNNLGTLPPGRVDLPAALARGRNQPTEGDQEMNEQEWARMEQLIDKRINIHFGAQAVNNPEAALNAGVMPRIDVNLRTELDKRGI